MPPLNLLKIMGNTVFFAKGLKLPVDWQQPQGDPDSNQYTDAFQPSERAAAPSLLPPWFTPASVNKYHVDQCDKVGKEFKKLHDDLVDALDYAIKMWKLQAGFNGLKVMAVSAIGQPGCLKGPDIEPLMKNAPSVASYTGNFQKWRDAVCKGTAKCFKEWQDQVTVPGLPWYPAKAAFPGPMSAPMPNIPMPLIACVSANAPKIMTPMALKSAMVDAFSLSDKEADKQFEALAEALGTVYSMGFSIWLPSQQVMLVQGTGSIPTFAPPYVPVGPVVNGQNLPGSHLMT